MGVEKVKNKTITFGVWEASALLINSLCVRIFLNYPRSVMESAGTAGWIETTYVTILAFVLFFIIEKLYSKFQGKDLLDISELIGGNIVRIIVGLLIASILLYTCSLILREYSENMKIISLMSSPISYVTLFFIVGMVTGAYAGLEAIVRFHAIAVPVISVASISILMGVLPFFDSTRFFPILGNGFNSIFISGFFSLSMYAPLIYLFLLPPFLKTHKAFKTSGYIGLGISAFFLIFAAVVYTGVYPYPTSLEFFLPTYQLARMMNFGRFFQRLESIFFLVWALTALMYLSIILYFITYLFKKALKLEHRKPLIIPFAIIIFSSSLLPPNLMTAITFGTKYYSYFTWAIAFALPIILLWIANVKKKGQIGGKQNNEQKN